jgi:hypothetical protein
LRTITNSHFRRYPCSVQDGYKSDGESYASHILNSAGLRDDGLAARARRDDQYVPGSGCGAGQSGHGLLGSYYKFSSSSNIGSLANANILESSSGGPTATFTTTEVCFPDCAGTSISDSNTMTQRS